jgi:hypothetical protein
MPINKPLGIGKSFPIESLQIVSPGLPFPNLFLSLDNPTHPGGAHPGYIYRVHDCLIFPTNQIQRKNLSKMPGLNVFYYRCPFGHKPRFIYNTKGEKNQAKNQKIRINPNFSFLTSPTCTCNLPLSPIFFLNEIIAISIDKTINKYYIE